MRGRLHHKFLAEIAMLDAVHTRADDPDGATQGSSGAGALTGGYDDDFGEILVFTTPAGERKDARKDQPSIFVPCNIASTSWDALQQMMAGNSPDSKVELTVHRNDLEQMELINGDTGELFIRSSDRILSVCDDCHRYVFKFREPLYVTQVAPAFGIATAPELFTLFVDNRDSFVRS